MTVILKDHQENNCQAVENLKYKSTFLYQGNAYYRVDSHGLRAALEGHGVKFTSQFYRSLNRRDKVVVMRVTTGRLSFFARTTLVREVDLIVQVKLKNDDC